MTYIDLKYHITFLIPDTDTLSQTWLSVADVAWLSSQAKLDGNFLLVDVSGHLLSNCVG
jgi:hypothetical protein